MNETRKLVRTLYKNDKGEPLVLTPKQIMIFNTISKRHARDGKRNIQCITYTRYGKSLVSALAVLTRVTTFAEKWRIVAPTDKKTRIIMGYIIEHIFDNAYTREKFQIGKKESMERIRRERSKNRLTFKLKNGRLGEVAILSAQEHRNQNPLDALMGEGSAQIVLDESSLIDNVKYAGILRMLGDARTPFIFEIGNPFRRNHFYETSKDSKYFHIKIDWRDGLKEGRITKEQIERMKDQPYFGVLYDCKFPKSTDIDIEGWIRLVSDEEFENACRKVQSVGRKRLGIDVAEGGDENAFVIRSDNFAYLKHKDREPDLMKTLNKGISFMKEENIKPEDVFIDATGDGAGVAARAKEMGYNINAVKVGEHSKEQAKYTNVRAEISWRARNWIREGGCLENASDFSDITDIKYQVLDSNFKTRIMPKKKMRTLGIESPNVWDAFTLTFAESRAPKIDIDYQPYYARRAGRATA